ncbi:MAG: biotin transporter BioY [Ignavibacteriae bacterium]|nr:MAG: biotin transporter BioY [Ignavibacteriota bacterium]
MIENRTHVVSQAINFTEQIVSKRAFWVFTFALLIAIGAQIEIPNQPVPFTLQTFFVLLAGALLGKRAGALSMTMYLMLGAAGLPVFSGGAFGLAKVIGPTGGYLLSFPVAAYAVGSLTRIRGEYWWFLISMAIGSLIIFTIGTIQLNLVYMHHWAHSIQAGFLLFSWWDGLKIVAAAAIAYSYFHRMKMH